MRNPRLICKDFKPKGKKIRIIPLGDIHYGARNCDRERVQGFIEYIKKHKDTYMIGMGDYLENATRHSVGSGVYEQDLSPREQYDSVVEMFKPIKHKILGLHLGNHEERSIKDVDMNPVEMLCRELDVKYLGHSVFWKMRVNKNNYILNSTHGSSGATLPHTKLNVVLKQARYIDADMYLYGHLHNLDSMTSIRKRVNMRNKQVEDSKKYYVLTGSFLKYEGSYAERKNMMPGKLGAPKISLFKDKWDCHVSL